MRARVVFSPQRERGPEPRGEGVRPHRAGARRRGVHHHHGAPLQPHPLAAGVPRGGRAPRVSVPRRGRRDRRGGDGREDRPAHEDRRGRARVERARHREPHRVHGRARACPRRLPGGGRRAIGAAPAGRRAGTRRRLLRVLSAQGARALRRGRALGQARPAGGHAAVPHGRRDDLVGDRQDAVWAPVPEKFEAGTQDAAGI